jgi:hypothetical protein
MALVGVFCISGVPANPRLPTSCRLGKEHSFNAIVKMHTMGV